MSVGFAIIGCGMIANFHAKAIADIRGAKLVACQNRTFSSAQKFASENGCAAYERVEDLVADPAVDVVTICTASGAHMEPAILAARAGKHLIIEKPLEVTLKRCDKTIQECEKAGVVVSTIFPSRFHKSAKLIKKAVEKERFGQLTLGDAYVKWFRTQAYYDSGAWRGTWELDGGGALMNQAIHSVDLLLWLMGNATEISAHTATLAHERIAVEDVATATLRFENGALGVIEATTASFPGSFKKIEIHGSRGCAILEEEDIVKWEFDKLTAADKRIQKEMSGQNETGGGAADPAAIGHKAHCEQFKDVLSAIKSGKQPLIDGYEGRRSVELILAIYKSAKSGKSVQLPLTSDPSAMIRKK